MNLSAYAAQELFRDSMSPEQIAWRPHTLTDLERNIATVEQQLNAIADRISRGEDLAYWKDCRERALHKLAILREAHSQLLLDSLPTHPRQEVA